MKLCRNQQQKPIDASEKWNRQKLSRLAGGNHGNKLLQTTDNLTTGKLKGLT